MGRTAIAEIARGFMSSFPDLHLTMDDLVIESDHAEFHWTLEGTNSRQGGRGHRVPISGFEVRKIGPNGLIAESNGHFDEAAYRNQLERGYQG